VESILANETGERIPANDLVELMVICFNTEHLAYQYRQETNNLMQRIAPALEQHSVLGASICIYNWEGVVRIGTIFPGIGLSEVISVYEFEFPFEPPMEDLKMVVDCDNGAKCYIFDTFCKNITPEEKFAADKRILNIYYRSAVATLIREENDKREVMP